MEGPFSIDQLEEVVAQQIIAQNPNKVTLLSR
jgi:hypothetical protein